MVTISSRKIIGLVLKGLGLYALFNVFFRLVPSLLVSPDRAPDNLTWQLLVLTAVQLGLGLILVVRAEGLAGMITGKDREIHLPESVSYPEILRLLIIVFGLWLSLYNLMHIGGVVIERILTPKAHLTGRLFATHVVNIVGGLMLIFSARKISTVIYTAPDNWVEGIDRLGSENFIALICVGTALLVFLFMLI